MDHAAVTAWLMRHRKNTPSATADRQSLHIAGLHYNHAYKISFDSAVLNAYACMPRSVAAAGRRFAARPLCGHSRYAEPMWGPAVLGLALCARGRRPPRLPGGRDAANKVPHRPKNTLSPFTCPTWHPTGGGGGLIDSNTGLVAIALFYELSLCVYMATPMRIILCSANIKGVWTAQNHLSAQGSREAERS